MAKEREKTSESAIEKIPVAYGDVFIRRAPDGKSFLRPVKAEMTLFERAGHLYSIKRGGDTTWAITAEGYRHLNKVASVSILTPPFVVADGDVHSNPYIERDPTTKLITAVWCRRIGVGYSPIGNVVTVDKTLYYLVHAYFIQGVQSAMSKAEWETVTDDKGFKKRKKTDRLLHPNMARVGVQGEKPDDIKGVVTRWVFFPTVPPIGIWLNIADSAAVDCLEDHTQRQRFGDRIAQSILDRLILRDHPAIGTATVEKPVTVDGSTRAMFTIYGFRNEMSAEQIRRTVEDAAERTPADMTKPVEIEPEEEEHEVKATRAEVTPAEAETPAPATTAKATDENGTDEPALVLERVEEEEERPSRRGRPRKAEK